MTQEQLTDNLKMFVHLSTITIGFCSMLCNNPKPTNLFRCEALVYFCLGCEVHTLTSNAPMTSILNVVRGDFKDYPCFCGRRGFSDKVGYLNHLKSTHPALFKLLTHMVYVGEVNLLDLTDFETVPRRSELGDLEEH